MTGKFKLRILRWGDYPGLFRGPNVFTSVLIRDAGEELLWKRRLRERECRSWNREGMDSPWSLQKEPTLLSPVFKP